MSAVSSDAGFSRAVISIRIVDIDYYLMPLDKYSPTLAFQAARLTLPGAHTSPKLPTVRIFGCTPAGQKACLHLHGARPFLYVPLPEGVKQADAASFSDKLRGVLESNLALSYAQDSVSGLAGQSAAFSVPAVPFIDNIEPVLRTSIYGYYPEPSIFLKISVYNPRNIQRIATILYSGIHVPEDSLQLQLQPFESHIPFILQIMTDLSLVGMGYINLSACKFRLPMPQSPTRMAAESDQDPVNMPPHERIFSNETLFHRPDLFWAFPGIRRTASELEIDAFVGDVLNPMQPSEPKFLGQRPGPDRYAAKTLRVLWEEEHVRTGLTPVAPEEQERSVVAGPTLSETHLVSKLYQLLNGKAASQKNSSIDEDPLPLSEMSDFQDVIQFLNSSSTTSVAEFGRVVVAEDDGCVTSDSAVDANECESDDVDDWGDIARSTQALLAIPQGDGHGHDVSKIEGKGLTCSAKKRSNHMSSSSRPLRRRLIGGYQRLQTLDDVPSDQVPCTPSVNHGQNENTKHECLSTDLKQSVDSLPNFSASRRSASLELCPDDSDSDLVEHSRYLDDNSMKLKPVEEGNEVDDGERFISNVVAPSCERKRQTILPADESFTALKNEIGRERKDNFLQYRTFFDVGENLPVRATLVCPKTVPPSRASVAGNFGLEKVPSLRYVQPFYGNFNDYNHKPHRFAGIANRVRCGGVRGLAHIESEFVQSGPPKITCLWSTLVPVRPPPCALVVASNGALTSEELTSGYSVGHRTALDSAGREVKITSRSRGEHQSCTPLSMLEGPAFDVKISRLRRRVETCIPNNDDCQTSGDSDSEDMSRPSRTCGARDTQDPQTQEPDPPLSPKYDDTTFFPETPCRSRKRATSSFDFDSPIHRVKAEGARLEVGKAPIAIMSRADHQNLTVTLIEVRTILASAAVVTTLAIVDWSFLKICCNAHLF
jgi:DNA polymerase family B, exonuclease domain